jgi:predicted RecB family nuclease
LAKKRKTGGRDARSREVERLAGGLIEQLAEALEAGAAEAARTRRRKAPSAKASTANSDAPPSVASVARPPEVPTGPGLAKIIPFPAQREAGGAPTLVITATDIYRRFQLRCDYQVYLRCAGEVPDAKSTLAQRLWFDRGIAREEAYIEHLRKRHGEDAVVEIARGNGTPDTARRVSETLDAMKRGVAYVVHGFFEAPLGDLLENGPSSRPVVVRGEADVLERMELPNAIGTGLGRSWTYRPVDVKSSYEPHRHQIAQVALYALLLGPAQGSRPGTGVVVTRARQLGSPLLHDFVESEVSLERALEDVVQFLDEELPALAADATALFHLSSKCGWCPYRTHCEDRTRREDDLSLVAGMTQRRKRRLLDAGIGTYRDLAISSENGPAPSGLLVPRHVRDQAISLVLRRAMPRSKEDMSSEESRHAPEGLSPAFSGARVYLDVESDPHTGTVYLAGYRVEEVRRSAPPATASPDLVFLRRLDAAVARYGALAPVQHIVALEPADERRMFETMLDSLDRLRAAYGRLSILHYGPYERYVLKTLAQRHPTVDRATERVAVLTTECADLYRLLREQFHLPVRSYSLKSVAPALLEVSGGRHGMTWRNLSAQNESLAALTSQGWSKREVALAWREIAHAARDAHVSVPELLDPVAENSIYWYALHQRRRHPVWLGLVRAYNEDDLAATREVAHWLMDQIAAGSSEAAR